MATHQHSEHKLHRGHTLDNAHDPAQQSDFLVAEIAFQNAYDGSELADLEKRLAAVSGVQTVHLDRTRAVAHVGYQPAVTSPPPSKKR